MPLGHPTARSITDQQSHHLLSETQHHLCAMLAPGCSQPVVEPGRDTQAGLARPGRLRSLLTGNSGARTPSQAFQTALPKTFPPNLPSFSPSLRVRPASQTTGLPAPPASLLVFSHGYLPFQIPYMFNPILVSAFCFL